MYSRLPFKIKILLVSFILIVGGYVFGAVAQHTGLDAGNTLNFTFIGGDSFRRFITMPMGFVTEFNATITGYSAEAPQVNYTNTGNYFNFGYVVPAGSPDLAYNGSHFFLSDSQTKSIMVYNSSGNWTGINASIDESESPAGLLWVDPYFYIPSNNDEQSVLLYNSTLNYTGINWTFPGVAGLEDMAYNGSHFLLLSVTNELRVVNASGNLTGFILTITAPAQVFGVAWDGYNVQIAGDNADRVYKYQRNLTQARNSVGGVDEGFLLAGGQIGGLTFNGSHIFHAAAGQDRIDIYRPAEAFPQNPKIGIGDSYNLAGWDYQGEYTDNRSESLNASTLNNLFLDGCACNDCTLVGNLCTFPLNISSQTPGILQLTDLFINYTFDIDNCTAYENNTFNLSILDQKTGDPITANATFQYSFNIGGADEGEYTVNMADRDNYGFCQYPNWTTVTGDMSHTLERPGYENLIFTRVDTPYSGNFYAYMLETEATSADILYTILDESNQRIEGASIRFYRIIDSVLTLVNDEVTDFAGQVAIYQDQQYSYLIEINASGFPFRSFNLKPVQTVYDIILTATGGSFYSSEYEGLRFRTRPTSPNFNITNTYHNLTLEIEGTGLNIFGINVTPKTLDCIPVSCEMTSTTSTGGLVWVSVNISDDTPFFYRSYFFQQAGRDLIYINTDPGRPVNFLLPDFRIVEALAELRGEISPNTATMLAAGGSALLIGLGASLGLFGSALIFLAIAANIFFSIVGYINPFVALIMSIVGFAMIYIGGTR